MEIEVYDYLSSKEEIEEVYSIIEKNIVNRGEVAKTGFKEEFENLFEYPKISYEKNMVKITTADGSYNKINKEYLSQPMDIGNLLKEKFLINKTFISRN